MQSKSESNYTIKTKLQNSKATMVYVYVLSFDVAYKEKKKKFHMKFYKYDKKQIFFMFCY